MRSVIYIQYILFHIFMRCKNHPHSWRNVSSQHLIYSLDYVRLRMVKRPETPQNRLRIKASITANGLQRLDHHMKWLGQERRSAAQSIANLKWFCLELDGVIEYPFVSTLQVVYL